MSWQKVRERVTDVVTRALLNLAQTNVVDDVVGRIVEFLNVTPPEVLLGYCSKGLGFKDIDPNYRRGWDNTIRGFARSAYKYGYTDRVIAIIDSITPEMVLENVIVRAKKDKATICLSNVGLIVNTPEVSVWFAQNVEYTKKYIKDVFLSAVGEVSGG